MSQRDGFVGSAIVVLVSAAAAPASAQFMIQNGAATAQVFGFGSGSSFAAGVIGPYGYGGGYSAYAPAYYPGYGYGGYGLGYGGYGYYGPRYYAGPIFVPAETMFGPAAVMRMMGVDQSYYNGPVFRPASVQQPRPHLQPRQPQQGGFGVLAKNGQGNNGFGNNGPVNNNPIRPNVPFVNAATQARAKRQVDSGDVLFQQQKFGEALSNYKDAARTAPDLAEAYFRQAAAQIAIGRYDDAATAIKFGLRLQPNWVDSKFRFSVLYGGGVLARQQHMAALQRAANDRPTSDVLFVYGVALFFDDHPRWAQAPLDRAQALAVVELWHIDLFLKTIEKLPPDPAPQPGLPPAANAAQPNPPAQPNAPGQRPMGRPDVLGGRDI